jgi:hypothetical protein
MMHKGYLFHQWQGFEIIVPITIYLIHLAYFIHIMWLIFLCSKHIQICILQKELECHLHIPSDNITPTTDETLVEYFFFVAPHWIITIPTLLLIFISSHMVLAKVVALWRLAYDLLPCEKEYETNDRLASYIQSNSYSLAIIIKQD